MARRGASGVTAVVLASGLNRIPLFPGYVPGYKALLPFHGRASIHYVLDALQGVREVDRVCIIGHKEDLEPELRTRTEAYELAEGGESLLQSVEIALRQFARGKPVLFVTADLPLITPQAASEFLAGCAAAKTDFEHNVFIAVVPQGCYLGPYLRFTKSFNRFRDVAVCHGNLALVDPEILEVSKVRERLNGLYSARKSPIRSALALGWMVGLTYALGVELLHVVTLPQMARIASKNFGFGIVPIFVERPEITIDVDEPDDYAFVREQLDPCES